jgi:hypothetical protein
MIGRFHEVSVHAPDMLESISFYERLGFTQVTAGEAWPYPYAVVADGRLAIGLHGRELSQSPLLAFVLPNLRERIEALERRGIEVADRRLGDDVFNEATLDVAGQLVRLLEARTHSPAPQGTRRDLAARLVRGSRAAGRGRQARGGGLGAARLHPGRGRRRAVSAHRPHQRLAERRAPSGRHAPTPALVFTDAEMPARVAKLAESGFEFQRRLPGNSTPRAMQCSSPRKARSSCSRLPNDTRRPRRNSSRRGASRARLGALRGQGHHAARCRSSARRRLTRRPCARPGSRAR